MEGIKFVSEIGQVVQTPTASFGLLKWFFFNQSVEGIEAKSKKEKKGGISCMTFGPYHEKFAVTILGAIERKFGKMCNIDEKLLEKEWYESELPEDKYNPDAIIENYMNYDKIQFYENWCCDVLLWLQFYNNIKDLKIKLPDDR